MSRVRLSLTPKQLETAIGVDLLALCQLVTADGRVTEEEVEHLRQWLEESSNVELPAIGYLRETVAQIVADGKITKEELSELHQAVEKILPPDYRAVSVSSRKDVAQQDKERRRSIADFDTMVAGLTHEGRAYVVHEHARVGDPVFLVRDRKNRYSKAAIEILLNNGMPIGFIPEEEAQRLAPLMDAGAVQIASIKKIWPGNRVDVPIIEGALYPATTEQEGCFAERDCPQRIQIPASYVALANTVMRGSSKDRSRTPNPAANSGCALTALALVATMVAVVANWT